MKKDFIKVFIGSSSEKQEVAEIIKELLEMNDYKVNLWKDEGFFQLGLSTLESLQKNASQYDFSIFVFSPDDKTESRGTIKNSIRDNIVFEIGLFMGSLGRERTLMLLDLTNDVKIPSDFNGITMASYTNKDPSKLKQDLSVAVHKILLTISTLGSKTKNEIEIGRKTSHFDYKKYSNGIYHCANKIRILHTYVLPFCNDPTFSEHRNLIIENIRHAIRNEPNFRIEFLFLNPYSASMDLRVKQRAPQNDTVPQNLRNMYGFFYLLTHGRKYSDISKYFKIKVYDQMPPFAMFQSDNNILITSFPKGKPVFNTNWYICHKDSILGKLIKGRFHEIFADPETYDLDVCFYICIREKQFHYIKHRHNIYIGITSKTKKLFDEISKKGDISQIEWLKQKITGTMNELLQGDVVSEHFETKFPCEKFIKYYVFVENGSVGLPEFSF